MTTFKPGDRVTYRDASTDHDYPPRVGTVVNTWTSDKSVSVQWDDAPKSSHPWYDTDALRLVSAKRAARAMTPDQRSEMNRLRATLEAVTAQRDTLARELLSEVQTSFNSDNVRVDYSRAALTVLTDLVESGNVVDVNGYLS